MTLSNPDALWLLCLLPLAWLFAWFSQRLHALQRIALATVTRSLTLLLLVIALAQPTVLEREFGKSVVYAMDVSRSVSSVFLNQALAWAAEANQRYRPDQVRYLVFADGLRLLESPEQVMSVSLTSKEVRRTASGGSVASDGNVIGQSATDIEAALHAAMFGFAPNHARRLVLISDGNETRGDLWRAVARLRGEQVRVFAMPAAASTDSDAWVESINFPPGVRQQEPITIRVTIRAVAAMPASVELRSGKSVIGRRSVQLSVGENVVAIDTRLPRRGDNVVTAKLKSRADLIENNNVLSASIRVGPRPRVLYVEGTPASAHYLAGALRAHYIDVTVATARGLDEDPQRINQYDAVILSDVFAHDLSPETVRRLGRFVRERGGGLVFAAGESTYGKQGYAGNDVERLLPVRFEGKRKRQELDLVLLIDRSHSMRGRKLELAKTAALSTLDLLEEQHRLSVIGFDSRPHEVVPLAEVGNKRRAEDRIASMTASGQTRIYPALAMAQRVLAGSESSTKHVILLSDGVTAPIGGINDAERIRAEIQRGREEAIRRAGGNTDPSESPKLTSIAPGSMEELVAQLAEEQVSLSTIAIGPRPNLDLMRAIAEIAGGKAYVAKNDAEMPGLFVSETRRLLGDSIVEEQFQPTVGRRADTLAGLDFDSGPPLEGFVMTRAKQFSDVLLRAPQDQPLLATTQYGLGRTAAFLSDVKNRWSAQWLSWDGYGRFWSQVVREVIARRAETGLDLRVSRRGSEAIVELTALSADFTYRNSLMPKVRMTSPVGENVTLLLRQVAPGEYRASLPIAANDLKAYRFVLLQGGGITAREATAARERTLSYTWTDEYRPLPPNNALLRELSERTGGVFAARAEDVFADYDDSQLVPRPLWYWFVAAALLLFLLDILIRRAPRVITVPRVKMSALFGQLRRNR
ncbi:MAG: VWA domain-containing protein [Betaproteobacteria bacterium]|nr:MAG: VWA domain-containing protein [Betaproteobacteria bacterium]